MRIDRVFPCAIIVSCFFLVLMTGCGSRAVVKQSDQNLELRLAKFERAVAEEIVRLENEIKSQAQEIERLKINRGLAQTGTTQALIRATPRPKPQMRMAAVDIEELYPEGRARFLRGDYEGAAGIFQMLAQKYPNHSLTPNTYYWLGECRFRQGRFESAINNFMKVETKFPKSHKAPEALLKIAYAYSSLGQGNDAMKNLDKLLKRYPSSSAAKRVKEGKTQFKP